MQRERERVKDGKTAGSQQRVQAGKTVDAGDYGNDIPSGNTVTIDANVQGYAGRGEGVAGKPAFNYMF